MNEHDRGAVATEVRESDLSARTCEPPGQLHHSLNIDQIKFLVRGVAYDSLRRIRNQALFDRIDVYELDDGDVVDADRGEPFDTLLDPSLHAAALSTRPGCVRERT